MKYFEHRRNSIADLKSVHPQNGVEIDLRSASSQELILAHDPFVKGETFKAWLHEFKRLKINGPVILNTKEDQLEAFILEELNAAGVRDFLFLDTCFPTQKKFLESELAKNFMIRVSRFESLEFALQFKGRAEWLWVDCFDGVPLDLVSLQRARESFKLCLVSPELHGKDLETHQQKFLPLLPYATAVCTKHPVQWSLASTSRGPG